MISWQPMPGREPADRAVPDARPIAWDAARGRFPKRVGYVTALFDGETDAELSASNAGARPAIKQLGCTLVPLAAFPSGDLSYYIEYTERSAAFDALIAARLTQGVQPPTRRL